jgi:hypothetical protein
MDRKVEQRAMGTTETKWQSLQWKSPSSPQLKKARMSRSSTKTMLVFFDIRNIVHRKFVPQGQPVNTKVLLRSSAVFEGEHSVKATGSVA